MAIQLRQQGKSQAEVAAIVGVHPRTVDAWEDTSNFKNEKANIPDLRIKLSRKQQEELYERHKAGEPQAKLAAEYKISQGRVSQIIRQVEARKREPEPVETPELPKKRYRCIVVDPPWPVPGWELPSQGSPQ